MNAYIEGYIKKAALFFPVLGREEKAYLNRMTTSIADYFAEQEPESEEAIVQAFGLPQNVVKEYLAGANTGAVVRRIGIRRILRRCTAMVLAVFLMVGIFFGVRKVFLFKAIEEMKAYYATISDIVDITYPDEEN